MNEYDRAFMTGMFERVEEVFPGDWNAFPDEAEWARADLVVGVALPREYEPGTRLVWAADIRRNRAYLRSRVKRHLAKLPDFAAVAEALDKAA